MQCYENGGRALRLHVRYHRSHVLRSSGKTIIEHIYDTHTQGVAAVTKLATLWGVSRFPEAFYLLFLMKSLFV